MRKTLIVLGLIWANVMLTPAWAKELLLAEVQAPGHVIVKSEEVFANRLNDLSKGNLSVQIKPSAQLGNEEQAWAKVRAGSLDIARVNLSTLVHEVPTVKILSLPYLFHSRDHMWHVLNGDFGKRLASEIASKGAVVLTYYDSGTRSFYNTKKPIRTLADFAGLRIRVQDSPIYQDLITQLGGKPVVIPFDKVDEAFKKGEIDGAENNLTSYVSSEHYKIARYYSMDEHSSVPEVLLMSKKTWDSLSEDQHKQVLITAADSSDSMKKMWAEAEAQSLAKAKKEGAVITEKQQISMPGIESFAIKLYTKYVTNPGDLDTVLTILRAK